MCISVSNRSLQLKQGCGLQELLRPDARSWGDWDRGTSYCLSPAAGGIHIIHMVTCVQMYILHAWTFLLISQKGEQDKAHGTVYVLKCSLCPSVLTSMSSCLYTYCVHVFVCVCLLGTHAQPQCCLARGVQSCISLASGRLLDFRPKNFHSF